MFCSLPRVDPSLLPRSILVFLVFVCCEWGASSPRFCWNINSISVYFKRSSIDVVHVASEGFRFLTSLNACLTGNGFVCCNPVLPQVINSRIVSVQTTSIQCISLQSNIPRVSCALGRTWHEKARPTFGALGDGRRYLLQGNLSKKLSIQKNNQEMPNQLCCNDPKKAKQKRLQEKEITGFDKEQQLLLAFLQKKAFGALGWVIDDSCVQKSLSEGLNTSWPSPPFLHPHSRLCPKKNLAWRNEVRVTKGLVLARSRHKGRNSQITASNRKQKGIFLKNTWNVYSCAFKRFREG